MLKFRMQVVGLRPQPAYGITSNTSSGTSVHSSVLAENPYCFDNSQIL